MLETLPLTWGGETVGELSTARQGLYTRFTAACRLPEEGLWCVWAIGEQGELRVGVPEPEGERAAICRSFSEHGLQGVGRLRAAVLRPVGEETGTEWQPVTRPEDWFRSPWLCRRLREYQGVLIARRGELLRVAIPFSRERPFPLVQLFCLAQVRCLESGTCAVYTFDRGEQPVLPQ